MAHDVFISYSTKDKSIADAIVSALETHQIRCWYAPRDIKPGGDWGEEIAHAIKASEVFLLVFSGNSNQSQRVLDELNLAITMEVVILPFRIEKLDPSGAMQLHLSSRHWLDAFTPTWKDHLDNLVESVSINLEKSTDVGAEEYIKAYTRTQQPGKNFAWILGSILGGIALILLGFFVLPMLLGQPANPAIISSPSPEALTSTVSPTETPTPTPSDDSTPTPTTPQLGSAEDPLVWMYVPPINVDFNQANAAAAQIKEDFSVQYPNLHLQIIPAIAETVIVNALCEGEAHLGSLSAFAFLDASARDCAEAMLIWSAYSDINFGGMIMANRNSGVSGISQLSGARICIPSFDSTSGWLLPSLEIRAATNEDPQSFFSEIIEIGGHNQVVEEVYNGNCLVGTAYFGAQDAVSLPNFEDRVEIISTTTIIPNSNLSFSANMPADLAQELVSYFLSSSQSESLILISGYAESPVEVQLAEINDYYYDDLRKLFQQAGEDPIDYLYQ
jgi:phosphate/phosphite/phosphonate ABC transporter binding protein